MRILLVSFFLTLIFLSCESKVEDIEIDFITPFESSKGTETATYEEVIEFYLRLAKEFPEINIQTIGETDSDKPLHLVTYNADGDFNFNKITKNKTVLLINNGIHPGESDGIDATMLLFRDLASGKISSPEQTVVVTIPIYNIGGALNRNSTTRANQNGPESYGFRGNALNYDLNRDFIKTDTKNARTFAKIYHLVKPDLFIDNHVSNGADYQYTLTHLFTQHNKLGGELGHYLHNTLMPSLEDSLSLEDWSITPYVNVFNKPPEVGFQQFMDHPRYSTGYTTLWNTLGMMVETHMLKPYQPRVEGTYKLMEKMIAISEKEGKKIKELRTKASNRHLNWNYYPTKWSVDSTKSSVLKFKGYQADTIISKVTGHNRLKYDRNRPFTKNVVYYNYFKATDSVKIPEAYIIKKQWKKVMDLLALNEIEFELIKKDTILQVESYRIEDYSTVKNPYEGHYLHYDTHTSSKMAEVNFEEGDIVVYTDQPGFRYIMETLEPSSTDSFFNWNFFDTILQQKEGFSPYVFEDTALNLLEQDTVLKKEFEAKKEVDAKFSENWYAQLKWIFERSPLYEKAHKQYPIYRVPKEK
ncbi:M14 family metallopeptidase [Maribacter thermophilus]|uniref:M14 family metallopeptidase n=1 Tax=Maribacter thermophilus TaxID=1197874 RepID=UPI0006418521|nr:M14 family metallopeptidase [Maribacter thermophilus]